MYYMICVYMSSVHRESTNFLRYTCIKYIQCIYLTEIDDDRTGDSGMGTGDSGIGTGSAQYGDVNECKQAIRCPPPGMSVT